MDVAAKLVGWDITLRRGGDKTGEPILHMKKSPRLLSCLGWDKGSKMKIKVRSYVPDGVLQQEHIQLSKHLAEW